MRREPLTRFDGTQIGTLTIAICRQCEDESRDVISGFVDRFLNEEPTMPDINPSPAVGDQTEGWPVEVLSPEGWAQWRDGVRGLDAQRAKVESTGIVPASFRTYPNGRQCFNVICPLCGRCQGGDIADKPIGGWGGSQRWTVQGLPDRLTMQPSIACSPDGSCSGHWFVREGRLVAA